MEGDARDRVGVHGHLRQRGEDRGSNSEERASGEAVPSVGGHAANGNTFNGHPAEFVPSGSRRGRHHNHETHPSRKFLLSYFLSLIINPPLLPNFFPFESFVSLQISILDDYKSQEEQWPCVQRESVGAAMELRSGTREIIREIERISCNPTLFVQEWREQPVLTRAKKIASIFIERILPHFHEAIRPTISAYVRSQFQNDNMIHSPPFNWTSGYIKFRQLAKKLDDLVNDVKKVVLVEQPTFWDDLEFLVPGVKSIFDKRWPDMKNDSRFGSIIGLKSEEKLINSFSILSAH